MVKVRVASDIPVGLALCGCESSRGTTSADVDELFPPSFAHPVLLGLVDPRAARPATGLGGAALGSIVRPSLVIKAPGSTYHRGRSREWLKVK